MSGLVSKTDFEADVIAELRDEGVAPVGVNLKVAERLSGISGPDLLAAILRGQIDARRSASGRIIVLYGSLAGYVLGLPAVEAR